MRVNQQAALVAGVGMVAFLAACSDSATAPSAPRKGSVAPPNFALLQQPSNFPDSPNTITVCSANASATFDVTFDNALGNRHAPPLTGGPTPYNLALAANACATIWDKSVADNAPEDFVTTATVVQTGQAAGFQFQMVEVGGLLGNVASDLTQTATLLSNAFHGATATFSQQLIPPPPSCVVTSLIASNFNGTDIPGGYYIWFNSIVKVDGRNGGAATIHFDAQTIKFNSTTLNVPGADITFAAVASASTTFSGGRWVTTVPLAYNGNVFLSGYAFQIPGGGQNGGINPVTWAGDFSTNQSGLSFQWKWAAAVYTSFTTNLNAVGAKPIDGDKLNPYANSDHAGTPESFKAFVTGGARGGGGSNWTGSYSGTGNAKCPN